MPGMESNSQYMMRALGLAKLGGRSVAPNPLVGAVLVHGGQVIGEGYHQRFGGPHAEVHAIASVTDRSLLAAATLHVTLEPCSHFGKTPPCADLIISSGIRNVVVGCRDPFPEVSGRGIAKLRDAGIAVTEGVLRQECELTNRRFITAQREGRPYTILKWAQSADGFMAPAEAGPYWISSEESRALAHAWRAQESAILVGRRTAEADDPRLTVRLSEGENPVRVVLDSSLRLPQSLRLFDGEAKTIVVNAVREGLSGPVRYCRLPSAQWSAKALGALLSAQGLGSVIVEGGAETLHGFIASGLWDEARIFVSPRELGGGLLAPAIQGAEGLSRRSGSDLLRRVFSPGFLGRFGLGDDYPLKDGTPLADA